MSASAGLVDTAVLLSYRKTGFEHKVAIGFDKMFVPVESFQFILGRDPESYRRFDCGEEGERHGECPEGDGRNAEKLHRKQRESSAVKEPSIGRENTGEDRSGRPAHAVNSYSAHRVVYLECFLDELYAEDQRNRGGNAYENGPERRNGGAAGGDRHQSAKDSVERHAHVGTTVLDPRDEHDGYRRCGRSQIRGDCDEPDGGIRSGKRASRVETEPAEPEDENTEGSEGEAMARNCACFPFRVELPHPGAEEACSCKCGPTAHGVDDGASGEVDEPFFTQPPSAPSPMSSNRIRAFL